MGAEGTSRKTALRDSYGYRLWDEDGVLWTDLTHVKVGFELTQVLRDQIADLLIRKLSPKGKAELCRRVLGITNDELLAVRGVANENDFDSLLAKLEGKADGS